MIIADSLGFLGIPGGPIKIDPELNLNLVHLTVAKPPQWGSDSMAEVRKEIRDFKSQLSASGRVYPFLEKGSELDGVTEFGGKTVAIFGLQHTPKDANPAELRTLGIKFVVLSYSGYLDDGTLTDKERNFILDCDKYGIGIDLSHTGSEKAKSILDFIKIAEVKIPAIASHTACYGQYPHKRNLVDTVLEQIAEQGGVVGINAISFFLAGKDKIVSINPMQSHLHRALCLCGVDNICIGSDIPYLNREICEWKEHFSLMKSKLDLKGKLGAVWPDYPVELNTANKEPVFTKMISSICDNKEKGQEIVSKILGANFYNFVKKNL